MSKQSTHPESHKHSAPISTVEMLKSINVGDVIHYKKDDGGVRKEKVNQKHYFEQTDGTFTINYMGSTEP